MPRVISPANAPTSPLRPPPAPPDPFVGRDAARSALARALDERGVAAITGLAGVGKTALLADYVARAGRSVEWVEIYPGLSDSGDALFWQVARPLADLAPAIWQTLHRMSQGGPPYPLVARLQVMLAAYTQLPEPPLLLIDAVEHLRQPDSAALLIALCDHVASGKAGHLQVAVAGRALPYRLTPYALAPLGGLDLGAARAWAQAGGLELNDADLAALLDQSGGVPLALADAFAAWLAEPAAPAESDRRLWSLLAGLPATERELLSALTLGNVQPSLSLDRRGDLAHLEDLHLVRRGTSSNPQVHPLIRTFLGAGMRAG
jgi:ATP/maltotriose-dependent transcriptional regulator MalT